jgi:hypothetical protein
LRFPLPTLTRAACPCSQQYYFFNQLSCFFKDFVRKGTRFWLAPPTADRARNKEIIAKFTAGCEHFECRGRSNTWCCAMRPGPLCTLLAGDTRVCHIRVNEGQRFLEHVLPHFGLLNASTRDYAVLNFGLWWGCPRCLLQCTVAWQGQREAPHSMSGGLAPVQ